LPDAPQSENELRERVLHQRLSELVDALITRPPSIAKQDEQLRLQRHSLFRMVCWTITASCLRKFDIGLSVDHRFNGQLRADKSGMQHHTSIARFVDDLERMLRDLYGESDEEALQNVRAACLAIVEEFTRHTDTGLCQEHEHALDFDYNRGIGVPEGLGLSGSDWRRGLRAEGRLAVRAFTVRANPGAFSKYTVEFVDWLDGSFNLRTATEIDRQLEAGCADAEAEFSKVFGTST
jgi:hypothetical protein